MLYKPHIELFYYLLVCVCVGMIDRCRLMCAIFQILWAESGSYVLAMLLLVKCAHFTISLFWRIPFIFVCFSLSFALQIINGNYCIRFAFAPLLVWLLRTFKKSSAISYESYHIIWWSFYSHINSYLVKNHSVPEYGGYRWQ